MCHPNLSVAFFSSSIRWRVGRHYVFNCTTVQSKVFSDRLLCWSLSSDGHQMKSGKTSNSSFLFHRSGKRFSNEAILFHAFLAITLCSNIMIRCVAWFLTICEQHSNWILLTNKSSVNGRTGLPAISLWSLCLSQPYENNATCVLTSSVVFASLSSTTI